MIKYVSTKGSIQPVNFAQAVLQGFAKDGGLFVPEYIPRLSEQQLTMMSKMSYIEMAFEIISLFIDNTIIPEQDLKQLIEKSFAAFEHPDLMPLVEMDGKNNFYIMELFHGPTLSFKDIAMGFLINIMDYLLKKKKSHLSIILATTGDTGPAAANAAADKPTIDCWPLYPTGMISKEQERQMTTLTASNIHPVSVGNCKDGGDDLDLVVAKLFSTPGIKEDLNLSSVNSINWCRVLVQSVHYAYGYFKVCDYVGEPVDFSVPSGAFGNLCAGFLARKIGIPINHFICANNKNKTLHNVFQTGLFKKEDLCPTLSSAIDIVVPYNFWRFLYFSCGNDPERLRQWMGEFEETGQVQLDKETLRKIKKGFLSISISDENTLSTIKEIWEQDNYLLDPHSAVAVCAAKKLSSESKDLRKTICLATAHPAKFFDVIKKALGNDKSIPDAAFHPSIVRAQKRDEKKSSCDIKDLELFLVEDIKKSKQERI